MFLGGRKPLEAIVGFWTESDKKSVYKDTPHPPPVSLMKAGTELEVEGISM